jgi:uncharacterized membrane protein YdjX (TVP38/TMEM64 family)
MPPAPRLFRLPRPSPLLIAVAVVGAAVLGLLAVRFVDLGALKTLIASLITTLRDAGPLVFFSAMAFLPAFGMPLMPFALAAGPVFSPVLGTAAVLACATFAVAVNITLSYWLAARGLRPVVVLVTTRLGYTLPQLHARTAWQWVLLARLAPGVPFFVQSYLLGLARAPLVPYAVLSVLIPMGYLGAAILGLGALLDGRTRTALIALAAFGLLALAVRLWQKSRATA